MVATLMNLSCADVTGDHKLLQAVSRFIFQAMAQSNQDWATAADGDAIKVKHY
jgi:hypothetical protein